LNVAAFESRRDKSAGNMKDDDSEESHKRKQISNISE